MVGRGCALDEESGNVESLGAKGGIQCTGVISLHV